MQKPDKDHLRAKIDGTIDGMIERFYKEVPFATHQMNGRETHLDYYKRHNIETILRLRMKRTIDALTIHYFTKTNPVLAKAWSEYTADEMLHDRMFVRDLEAVGVSTERIYSEEPLFATKLLQGYFYYGLEHEGRPLASLTSSYFIEYATVKTQPFWLDNLEKTLGKDKVQGARAHVEHDVADKHLDFVWRIIGELVKTPADERSLFTHLESVYRLFCMYFTELYQVTVARDERERCS